MATIPSEEVMARQASFIFKGTVLKLKASNVAQVEARDKDSTIIVRVDEITKAPEGLADFKGREVTVKLRGGAGLKIGDHALFYTNGWIRSENLAVEEVGHLPIESADTDTGEAADADAGKSSSRDLQKRLASADVVVTGRVASIRIAEDAEPQRIVGSSTLDKPAKFPPADEHKRQWREALIAVAELLKGAHESKEIVVRFPASEGVRAPQATEFHTGQEGIFILHKTRKAGETAEEAKTSAAYTAFEPEDFQPLAQLEQIRKLLKESAGKRKG